VYHRYQINEGHYSAIKIIINITNAMKNSVPPGSYAYEPVNLNSEYSS